MRPGTAGPMLLLMALVIVPGCDRTGEPAVLQPIPLPAASPEDGALALFRFASTLRADSILPEDLVRDDLAEQYGADLLDRLETLAGSAPPRILAVEMFPESDRAAVDLEFDLSGGGFSTWSVQLERGSDDCWRLVWAQGPGDGWPPLSRGRGEGLSTSEAGDPK